MSLFDVVIVGGGPAGLSAALVAGILAAGLSSWLAIAVLLRFISRNSFGVFAVYRVLLGLFVLGSLYVWN